MQEYIHIDTGKRIKVRIEFLPDSVANKLKPVEPIAEPEIIKEKRGRKPKEQ